MFLILMQAISQGIDDLVKEYSVMMKCLALRILNDEYLAEDAVQEALIRLSQNMDCLDEIKTARSRNFVYTVTKNAALTIQKNIFDNGVTIGNLEELSNIEGDVDIKAFCNEYGFSDEIAQALEQLEEIDRDIICYKYGGGYSSKEIGKFTGLKPANVRKRLERALMKLQNVIDESRKE